MPPRRPPAEVADPVPRRTIATADLTTTIAVITNTTAVILTRSGRICSCFYSVPCQPNRAGSIIYHPIRGAPSTKFCFLMSN
jgi:hypothetical protein